MWTLCKGHPTWIGQLDVHCQSRDRLWPDIIWTGSTGRDERKCDAWCVVAEQGCWNHSQALYRHLRRGAWTGVILFPSILFYPPRNIQCSMFSSMLPTAIAEIVHNFCSPSLPGKDTPLIVSLTYASCRFTVWPSTYLVQFYSFVCFVFVFCVRLHNHHSISEEYWVLLPLRTDRISPVSFHTQQASCGPRFFSEL